MLVWVEFVGVEVWYWVDLLGLVDFGKYGIIGWVDTGLLMILASAVPLFRIKLVALIDRSPPLVIEAMAPLFPVVPPVRVTFPATLSVDVTVRLPLVEILARLPTTL